MDLIGMVLALLLVQLAAAPAADLQANVKIALVGDSTVTDGSGWGRDFKKCLGPGVDCGNAAQAVPQLKPRINR